MYGGDTDQLVYYELFREVTGQVPTNVPERGTGVTTPVVVRLLFAKNGIAADRVEGLTRAALGLIPQYLSKHCDRLVATGKVMPGAAAALQAVREDPRFVSTAVTGNLRSVAHIKLAAFGLAAYLDLDSGGFSSDDERRPRLVGVAQTRALITEHSSPTRTQYPSGIPWKMYGRLSLAVADCWQWLRARRL